MDQDLIQLRAGSKINTRPSLMRMQINDDRARTGDFATKGATTHTAPSFNLACPNPGLILTLGNTQLDLCVELASQRLDYLSALSLSQLQAKKETE